MRPSAREKISNSLLGKFGEDSRRWKGEDAGYVAKHLWIIKHYGKATLCSINPDHESKKYEWHNKDGLYRRDRNNYIEVCPSCHQLIHKGDSCKRGHRFTSDNTYIRKEGWRVCRICQNERNKKWNNG